MELLICSSCHYTLTVSYAVEKASENNSSRDVGVTSVVLPIKSLTTCAVFKKERFQYPHLELYM